MLEMSFVAINGAVWILIMDREFSISSETLAPSVLQQLPGKLPKAIVRPRSIITRLRRKFLGDGLQCLFLCAQCLAYSPEKNLFHIFLANADHYSFD